MAGRSTCGGRAAKGPGELTPSILPDRPNGFARVRKTAPHGERRPVNTTVTAALAIGALVVLAAALALRLSDRLGLPSLLLYLALGLALGEGGLGVDFENAALTPDLGGAALVVILAAGGLTTRWGSARGAIGPGLALSTVGVVVSVSVTAAAAAWLVGLPWGTAVLIAAVVSSTDAPPVFATLRRLPLPRRLTAALEVESGLNDAPVILLVLAVSEN